MTGSKEEHIYLTENWKCRAIHEGMLPSDFNGEHFGFGGEHPGGNSADIGRDWRRDAIQPPEILCFSLAVIVGTILFAMIQGIIVQVLTTGNPDETAFKQNLDALNYMMEDNGFDKDSRVRVRAFFRKSNAAQT